MGRQMGFGLLADPKVIFKRKFRWGLSLTSCGKTLAEEFVKTAARPKMTIDETEINMKNGKMWIPGKAYWDQMTVTFYDVVSSSGTIGSSSAIIFGWLATIYNFTNKGTGSVGGHFAGIGGDLFMASSKGEGTVGSRGYAARLSLNLYDGRGNILETWNIYDAWPVSVDFGTLEYNSSDELTIETSIRYSDVSYTPQCNQEFDVCQDTGCGN
jgi:hypothetical protein